MVHHADNADNADNAGNAGNEREQLGGARLPNGLESSQGTWFLRHMMGCAIARADLSDVAPCVSEPLCGYLAKSEPVPGCAMSMKVGKA